MHRNTLLEMSARAMHQIVRFTLNDANDNPMMQELNFDGMNSEGRKIVERVQAFGFTSTPLPRDQQQGQQGQSNGGGGNGGGGGLESTEQPKGPAAEGIAVFLGGQRNHPVVIAIDDRRHRPMGLKPGENAQYDDIGQMTLLRRTGLYLLSLDDDQQQGSAGQQDSSSSGGSGQSTTRMVSLRHVQKQKQQRPGQSGSSSSSSSGGGASASARDSTGGSSSGGQQQDFQHEGQTVNHEVRITKGRIEFYSGDTVVGYYDKQSTTWCFIGKVKLGTESAQNPVYGVNGGVGMTSDPGGSDAVLVNAPKPGPPTSQDTEP
jgi:phage gp45-like